MEDHLLKITVYRVSHIPDTSNDTARLCQPSGANTAGSSLISFCLARQRCASLEYPLSASLGEVCEDTGLSSRQDHPLCLTGPKEFRAVDLAPAQLQELPEVGSFGVRDFCYGLIP